MEIKINMKNVSDITTSHAQFAKPENKNQDIKATLKELLAEGK
jgi:hypothetical protein